MYATVSVILPSGDKVLVIPTTAVLYAPYSDSVFVLEEQTSEGKETPALTLRQQFIRLGDQRGDFVAVTSGLQEGQSVVSTGVFKYRNGQSVVVDNSLAPAFSLSPEPPDR